MSNSNINEKLGYYKFFYIFLPSIKNFNYEPYLFNDCRGLIQNAVNFNDVAIASIKGNHYRIHCWYMNKDDSISIMSNSNINEKLGYYKFFYIFLPSIKKL